MAAFADGAHGDEEREALQGLAGTLGGDDPAAAGLLQDVLFRRVDLASLCAPLAGQTAAAEVFAMAASVCEADRHLVPAEQAFLQELRLQLRLDAGTPASGALLLPEPAVPEVPGPQAPADPSGMILNYAILAGALELLPQTLATAAVLPMQLKMVYRIGQAHGVELDPARIKELVAAAGLGLTSQVLEGYARRLVGGLFGKKSKTGGLARQAAGSAFAFASTYALGHVAEAYYSAGRRLDGARIKALFDEQVQKARGLYDTYLPQIREKAQAWGAPGQA